MRITTIQNILKDIPPVQEGFPMRGWSIQISLVNSTTGKEVPATIFDKVTYSLHPTFQNPVRVFKKPPFKIEEEGWGEFDMMIALHFVGGGEVKLNHDLNFRENKYITDHKIQVPATKPAMLKLLADSGSVPTSSPATEESSTSKRKSTSVDSSRSSKKSKTLTGSGNNGTNAVSSVKGSVDLEKLAFGLTKLSEDNLLTVVQMVTDNRTPDMNVKNDVDEGEFTMDLYTFPDALLKSLWDYVKKASNID